jgi:hypothetical protein
MEPTRQTAGGTPMVKDELLEEIYKDMWNDLKSELIEHGLEGFEA